jgi:serine/threonine protein kinase
LTWIKIRLAKNVKTDRAMTVCGTPEFMAPEQWHADKAVTEQADMWALGCLIYLMLVGRTPFYDADKRTYDRAKALAGSFAPPPADLCDDDARAAIADLLHLAPGKRCVFRVSAIAATHLSIGGRARS